MATFIVNALPASVLLGAIDDRTGSGRVVMQRITPDEFRALAVGSDAQSAVGHEDTARILTEMVGLPVAFNRQSVPPFGDGCDELLCGLYTGPRLPEGATSLPEGGKLDLVRVRQYK